MHAVKNNIMVQEADGGVVASCRRLFWEAVMFWPENSYMLLFEYDFVGLTFDMAVNRRKKVRFYWGRVPTRHARSSPY